MSYVNMQMVAKPPPKAKSAPRKRERERGPRRYAAAARAESMQETRDALLAAAGALFAEQGLDAPSLDAICARAGRTRGAFYVHFQDRDALIDAVLEHTGQRFLDAVSAPGDAPGGLALTVQRFIDAMLRGEYPLTQEGGVKPHQLLDACARSPRIRRRYLALIATTLERVGALIASGQGSQALRADVDAAVIAQVLLATVIGAQTMLELKVPLDVSALAAAVMTLLLAR